MAVKENPEEDDAVIALEPDQMLRELIGRDTQLSEIFTKERIEACQNTIDDARGTFFEVAHADLSKLEALVNGQDASAEVKSTVCEDIAGLAADIRGHAEIFGFTLIAAISNHIAKYCEPGIHPAPAHFRLIADLVKMLHVAIKEKVGDEGGAMAQELNAILKNY